MKQGVHPEYVPSHVRCTCGNEFWTRSTKPEMHVEICSNCHPFYTGKQKLVDTGGRVERFQKKYANRAKPKAEERGAASAGPQNEPAEQPAAAESADTPETADAGATE